MQQIAIDFTKKYHTDLKNHVWSFVRFFSIME